MYTIKTLINKDDDVDDDNEGLIQFTSNHVWNLKKMAMDKLESNTEKAQR